jgi:hypothetical protein
MGVGKSMKIFMEGIQNSMNSTSTGGKILNTPMGPFAWNDNLQMWVNVNNGFSMPNISMQDMMAIGYDTLSGDNISDEFPPEPIIVCTDLIPAISSTTLNMNINSIVFLPGSVTTPTLSCSPYIYLTDNNAGGAPVHQIQFQYTVDSGTNYTSYVPRAEGEYRTLIPFPVGGSLGSTVRFKAFKKEPTLNWTTPGSYSFTIKNGYDRSTIGAVTLITTNIEPPEGL